MNQLLLLIAQLLFISIMQTVIEAFLDTEKREQQKKILNIACILGSLYFLLQFVFTYVIKEINTLVKLPF
ncbi:MAG: hypothetical protein FWC55_07040 [Firmicutes bacterium]|nr:hypothetical protein [Bacillota bacterium]